MALPNLLLGVSRCNPFADSSGSPQLFSCLQFPVMLLPRIASRFSTTRFPITKLSPETGAFRPSSSTTASASCSTPATTRKSSSTTSRPSTLTLQRLTSPSFLTVTPITLPGLSIYSRSNRTSPFTSPPMATTALAVQNFLKCSTGPSLPYPSKCVISTELIPNISAPANSTLRATSSSSINSLKSLQVFFCCTPFPRFRAPSSSPSSLLPSKDLTD